MARATLNPITAFLQASPVLPITITGLMEHIDRTLDPIEAAQMISGSDCSYMEPSVQIELVGSYLSSTGATALLTHLLARTDTVDVLTAMAVFEAHRRILREISVEFRANYFSCDAIRTATRQILRHLSLDTNQPEDGYSFLSPTISGKSLKAAAGWMLGEIAANNDANGRHANNWSLVHTVDRPDPMHGTPELDRLRVMTLDIAEPTEAEVDEAVAEFNAIWAQALSKSASTGEITVEQAAQISGKTTVTIARWLKAHPELGRKNGGRWVVYESALRKYLSEGETE